MDILLAAGLHILQINGKIHTTKYLQTSFYIRVKTTELQLPGAEWTRGKKFVNCVNVQGLSY